MQSSQAHGQAWLTVVEMAGWWMWIVRVLPLRTLVAVEGGKRGSATVVPHLVAAR